MKTLTTYIYDHRQWSLATFGPGVRTDVLCRHIARELAEIRADPTDVFEWVDVVILALDGAWRAGYSPEQVAAALVEKQHVNYARQWNAGADDEPIEHKRRIVQ